MELQGLLHGLGGADALQDGVGADAVGQVLDAGDAFLAALGDDVGGAELQGELLPGLVAAHGDDPLGAQFLRGDDAAQADRAVTDDHGGRAGLDLGGEGGVPAGAHHVGDGQQARAPARRPGARGVATRVPWALGMRTYSAWQVLMNSRCRQEDW